MNDDITNGSVVDSAGKFTGDLFSALFDSYTAPSVDHKKEEEPAFRKPQQAFSPEYAVQAINPVIRAATPEEIAPQSQKNTQTGTRNDTVVNEDVFGKNFKESGVQDLPEVARLDADQIAPTNNQGTGSGQNQMQSATHFFDVQAPSSGSQTRTPVENNRDVQRTVAETSEPAQSIAQQAPLNATDRTTDSKSLTDQLESSPQTGFAATQPQSTTVVQTDAARSVLRDEPEIITSDTPQLNNPSATYGVHNDPALEKVKDAEQGSVPQKASSLEKSISEAERQDSLETSTEPVSVNTTEYPAAPTAIPSRQVTQPDISPQPVAQDKTIQNFDSRYETAAPVTRAEAFANNQQNMQQVGAVHESEKSTGVEEASDTVLQGIQESAAQLPGVTQVSEAQTAVLPEENTALSSDKALEQIDSRYNPVPASQRDFAVPAPSDNVLSQPGESTGSAALDRANTFTAPGNITGEARVQSDTASTPALDTLNQQYNSSEAIESLADNQGFNTFDGASDALGANPQVTGIPDVSRLDVPAEPQQTEGSRVVRRLVGGGSVNAGSASSGSVDYGSPAMGGLFTRMQHAASGGAYGGGDGDGSGVDFGGDGNQRQRPIPQQRQQGAQINPGMQAGLEVSEGMEFLPGSRMYGGSPQVSPRPAQPRPKMKQGNLPQQEIPSLDDPDIDNEPEYVQPPNRRKEEDQNKVQQVTEEEDEIEDSGDRQGKRRNLLQDQIQKKVTKKLTNKFVDPLKKKAIGAAKSLAKRVSSAVSRAIGTISKTLAKLIVTFWPIILVIILIFIIIAVILGSIDASNKTLREQNIAGKINSAFFEYYGYEGGIGGSLLNTSSAYTIESTVTQNLKTINISAGFKLRSPQEYNQILKGDPNAGILVENMRMCVEFSFPDTVKPTSVDMTYRNMVNQISQMTNIYGYNINNTIISRSVENEGKKLCWRPITCEIGQWLTKIGLSEPCKSGFDDDAVLSWFVDPVSLSKFNKGSEGYISPIPVSLSTELTVSYPDPADKSRRKTDVILIDKDEDPRNERCLNVPVANSVGLVYPCGQTNVVYQSGQNNGSTNGNPTGSSFVCPFSVPAGGTLRCTNGYRPEAVAPDPKLGQEKHPGIDYNIRVNDLVQINLPVAAPIAGTVSLGGDEICGYSVTVTSPTNDKYYIGHLERPYVIQGQSVDAGTALGIFFHRTGGSRPAGSTTPCWTGAHVHIEHIKPDGAKADPFTGIFQACKMKGYTVDTSGDPQYCK